MTYGIRRRQDQRRRAAKLEAARWKWDEEKSPEEYDSTAALNASIYRLQSRDRDGRYVVRIRELLAELQRRHDEEKSPKGA